VLTICSLNIRVGCRSLNLCTCQACLPARPIPSAIGCVTLRIHTIPSARARTSTADLLPTTCPLGRVTTIQLHTPEQAAKPISLQAVNTRLSTRSLVRLRRRLYLFHSIQTLLLGVLVQMVLRPRSLRVAVVQTTTKACILE